MAAPKKTAPKKATVVAATNGIQGNPLVITSERQAYRHDGGWIAVGGKVPGRASIAGIVRSPNGHSVAVTSDGHAYALINSAWVEYLSPVPGTTAAG